MNTMKRRRPFTASVLSLITPGLGQLYNAQHGKAALFYACALLFYPTISLSHIMLHFNGMLLLLVLVICFLALMLFDAAHSAYRLQRIKLRIYHRCEVYLGILLAHLFAVAPLMESVVFPRPIKAYVISSVVMEPAVEEGDRIIASLSRYQAYSPHRGDIIVCTFAKDPSKDFIKRIIGLPGEEIEIRDGKVFIDHQGFPDPWGTHTVPTRFDDRETFDPVIIPAGEYFVMGDNREHNYDSRSWGLVDASHIKGKALYIYWARDKGRIGKTIQ
jgi:signal peptidase I